MKIAVTYENEEVFQHFGKTERFKVYEVIEGKVESSKILKTNGLGHSALAGLLSDLGVQVLICGGLGGGAEAALKEKGIIVFAGASGNADKAVEDFLSGDLQNTGANCDHHEEEQDGCEGCEGSCEGCEEGSCEGCSGCSSAPQINGPNVGKKCRTHYRGTFNDGTEFDSSYKRGEPLEFICGAGQMIRGFDAAVALMEVGETVDIHLTPSEAYGEADPSLVFSVETAQFPGAENLEPGQKVYLQNTYGQAIPVTVVAKDETTTTFDANHEMAGKELNFTIELVEVLDA